MADTFAQSTSVDIRAAQPGTLQWNSDQVQPSLDALLKYVEAQTAETIEWYWANKKWKARMSRWIRLWALIFTAAAGLLPVISYIARESKWIADGAAMTSGLWASALVGVAAALLGMDRAFGFSSGWARYVLTATELRTKLEEFRMDWLVHAAGAGPAPTADQIVAFIQKAKEFRVGVEGIVAQETKDWVTEFQSSMVQIEKDVRAQLDALKAQVDKTQEARKAATQPGSIEATIENADQAKDFAFSVTLDGATGVMVKDERVSGSKTWARLNVEPGQYRILVNAISLDSKPTSAATVVLIKPAEVSRPSIKLPLA